MTDIVDAELAMIDRKIAELTKQREERYDFLVRPDRKRIREIYEEIAEKFSELDDLEDDTFSYGDNDQETAVSFEGKYFSYFGGNIEEK